MTNVLVDLRFIVDVPEEELERLVGRPDDDSERWYQEACQAAEARVEDDLAWALDHAGMPTVQAS